MRKLALVSAMFSFSLLSLGAQCAFAQDAPEAPAPAPVLVPAPPPGAVLVPVEEAPPMKQFAIVLNPLATAIDRYSIQGEYLPALHHAITLNPFYTHAAIKVTGSDADFGTLSGFGGELGYRLYTGAKGPNGFFVGPSFLFASYSQSGGIATAAGVGNPTTASSSFTSFGGAIDIGGQGVIGPGIVIGGGFGLQWTKNSKDLDTSNLNLASAIIAGGGTRPRFLFSIGYAF
jgi:hypothetical protein